MYANVTVKSGSIYMGAGAMKYVKTYWTMKKTFRQLAFITKEGRIVGNEPYSLTRTNAFKEDFGQHTLIGLTPQHKHGRDTIKVGWQRDVNYAGQIKLHPQVHALKTHFSKDKGQVSTTISPTEIDI